MEEGLKGRLRSSRQVTPETSTRGRKAVARSRISAIEKGKKAEALPYRKVNTEERKFSRSKSRGREEPEATGSGSQLVMEVPEEKEMEVELSKSQDTEQVFKTVETPDEMTAKNIRTEGIEQQSKAGKQKEERGEEATIIFLKKRYRCRLARRKCWETQ